MRQSEPMEHSSVQRLTWLNKLPNIDLVTDVGSILAPAISPARLPYPYRMTLVTTRQCNSRCQMCNIWQQKDLPQLSLDELRQIFVRNDFAFLRSVTITGGEATMRNDLPEFFAVVADGCKNLEHVVLATSALNTKRTLRFVQEMLEYGQAHLPRLRKFQVQISIDGIGELHDQIRGIRGFFKILSETLSGLEQMRAAYPMLEVRSSTVVLPENIDHVAEIRSFAAEHKLHTHFSPVIISDGYYENTDTKDELALNPTPSTTPVELFRKLASEDTTAMRFHYTNIAQMLTGSARNRRCMMGYYDFVLEYNGDVYACVNCEDYRFGNLFEQTFEELWFGSDAISARQQVKEKCCPTCTSPCHYPVVSAEELLSLKVTGAKRRLSIATKRLTRALRNE